MQQQPITGYLRAFLERVSLYCSMLGIKCQIYTIQILTLWVTTVTSIAINKRTSSYMSSSTTTTINNWASSYLLWQQIVSYQQLLATLYSTFTAHQARKPRVYGLCNTLQLSYPALNNSPPRTSKVTSHAAEIVWRLEPYTFSRAPVTDSSYST